MKLVLLDFGRPGKGRREAVAAAVWDYLAGLHRNGYAADFFYEERAARLVACALMPDPAALPRFHSRFGRRELAAVKKACGRAPRRAFVGPGTSRPPSWRSATFLYLQTSFLDYGSAVHASGEQEPIPAYLLPVSDPLREDLFFWTAAYQAHDRLWINSGALEIPAYRQIADPRSELASDGREICAAIEKATRKPTYYYLDRYYGRRRGEDSRPCPLCGKPWARREVIAGGRRRFVDFAFRCDRCRLVSHVGDEIATPRLARIGEFRPHSLSAHPAPSRQGRRR
jgi:predicted  nucleic acid-binding Zn ribbon protein